MQLSEYQNVVNGSLEELAPIVQKYGAPDSPLGEKASRLESDFQHAKRHCAEQLAAGRPRIMLYGVYNSGKSTLLNALMGEVRARMDDKPTTDRVDRYEWQGYELFDTPGIDAPIEHQEISEKQLEECQVILFVVSAHGTFESQAVFESMRDVILSGKRLFIILNDKQGMGESDSTAILQAVQQNLINVGLSPEKAAEFTPCLVNARWALDGRLEHDETLVSASGIRELETRIFEEIRRVDGFHLAADLCIYLSKDVITPFIDRLREVLDQEDPNTLLNESLQLRKEYREFCEGLKSRIETSCASMTGRLMKCFPAFDDSSALKSLNIEDIKSKMRNVYSSYVTSLLEDVRLEVSSYRDSLSRQLQKLLDAPAAETLDSPKLSEDQIQEIGKLLEKVQSLNLASDESTGLMQTLEKLLSTPLSSVIGPNPLPTGCDIPVGLPALIKQLLKKLPTALRPFISLLIRLAPDLIKWLLDNHKDGKRHEAMDLLRKQLEIACHDLSSDLVQKLQAAVLEACKNTFEPILQQVEAEIREKDSLSKSMQTDVLKLDEIRHRLDAAAAELQARA